MRKSGQITVFLSLVLLCVCSLVCGLVESARTAGAGWYLKLAADSAMDSVFSGYHREAWEQYRLFLLEYEEEEEPGSTWLKYMEPYMEEHGWYPAVIKSAAVKGISDITDKHGANLKQEIQDYMRFGIWDTVSEESEAENLWKELKEAESLQHVSEAYSGHAREAARMERALEAIWKSLESQEEYRQKAAVRLADRDGAGFRTAAKQLKKEGGRLPGLIKTYEKKADDLAAHLEKTREETKQKWEDLSEGVRSAMEEELAGYESYISENGAKRLEIRALIPEAEGNTAIIDRAVERSYEVEEIIAEWDEEDEGGGPDEGALWDSVEVVWDRVKVPELSFRAGLKEADKQNLLEQIQQMAGLNLLMLVLPEGEEVSKGVIQTKSLPSVHHTEDILKDSFLERVLTDEYIGRFFTCFRSEDEKEVCYEQEYVLGGKSTDEENLKSAAARILAVREGLNLIHILSDSQKREEAHALAAAITGVTGTAPLTGIVAFFVMTVWALGESAADVKALLGGERVPLIKTKETWNLDLDGLLALGEQGKVEAGQENGAGKNYEEYLKMLMFMEPAERLYYRVMDVVQINLSVKQPGFTMERCACQAEIVGTGTGKHLFWLGGDPCYTVEVHTDKAY